MLLIYSAKIMCLVYIQKKIRPNGVFYDLNRNECESLSLKPKKITESQFRLFL